MIDALHFGRQHRVHLFTINITVAGDLRSLGAKLAVNAGLIGFTQGSFTATGRFGIAQGSAALQLQLLGNLSLLLLTLNGELGLDRIQLCLAHRYIGLRFNLGTLLLIGRHYLRQASHPDRVEGIVLIQSSERSLIHTGNGRRLQQEAVARHFFTQAIAHRPRKSTALFMHGIEGISGSDGLQRVHKTSL